MLLRVVGVLSCWLGLACAVEAEPRNVTVSGPTRLDWEFVSHRFARDAADQVDTYDSKKQRYQLYIPQNYSKTRSWPLIVFVSPSKEPVGWDRFEHTCVREGIFFCSPHRAGNTVPGGLRSRIILDVTDDVRRRFRIDPDQTYIGGFSGGGRLACTVGFAMPEIFSGIIPVCGTNPPGGLAYLRHRLVDRVSVAFVTGEQDFNRRENEVWMAPYLKDLEIRSRLWIAPGLGHDIPGPAVMDDVVAWLAADVKRRRDDARDRPLLNFKADEALRDDALANRLLDGAQSELKHSPRVWQGVAILHGVSSRWPKSQAAVKAKELLEKIAGDERLVEELGPLRLNDDRNSFTAQARGLERIGMIPKAIEVWEALASQYPDSSVADAAQGEIRRLKSQPASVDSPQERGGPRGGRADGIPKPRRR
jgi:hypothetical protein